MSAEPAPTPVLVNPAEEPAAAAAPAPVALSELPPPAQLPNEPALDASPLKPLLNPLQNDGPPPSSTIVEPPRSPRALAFPPSAPPTDGVLTPQPAPEGLAPLQVSTLDPSPVDGVATPNSLPRDAPMPPTPQPRDETPPTLPAGAIPPAVPTPEVITTPGAEGAAAPPAPVTPPPAAVDVLPEAFPTPSGTTFDPVRAAVAEEAQPVLPSVETPAGPTAPEPTAPVPHVDPTPPPPAPVAQSATEPVDEAMDVDAEGEDVAAPPGLSSSASTGSLKRPGDELEGREEKRPKEEDVAPLAVAAPPAPAEAAANGVAPPPTLVPAIHADYRPPPPRASGPTTPLTHPQHKHMLNAVRTLKKNPNGLAFLEPVDPVKFNIPTYPMVVTKPMDLGTVETKLIVSDPRGPPKDKSKMGKWDESKGSYSNVSQVVDDIRQIFENTRMFNGPAHVVSLAADKLEESLERSLRSLPTEVSRLMDPWESQLKWQIVPLPPSSPATPAGPAAAAARRASISQPPVIRRISDGPDSRPKREIHPPPSKDLAYLDGTSRKPKRRNDPQLQWAAKTVKGLESTQKHYSAVSPFLFPVDRIIAELPDYSRVIKKPIDLNIIKEKLENGDYDEVAEVNVDMKLMVSNAMKFNPPGHDVHTAAQQLQQIWEEKWRTLPPKVEPRDMSEDFVDDEDDFLDEDDSVLQGKQAKLESLRQQVAALEKEIAEYQAKARRSSKPSQPKKPKAGGVVRKQSMSKVSPGLNGHGGPKKPRKSKEANFREEEDEYESEEETRLTLSQKQELADKMTSVDAVTLNKAVELIQSTTDIGEVSPACAGESNVLIAVW